MHNEVGICAEILPGLIPTDEIHTQETINKHYKGRGSKTKTKIAMTEVLQNEIVRNK